MQDCVFICFYFNPECVVYITMGSFHAKLFQFSEKFPGLSDFDENASNFSLVGITSSGP